MRILIVGAGVGGMTLAALLKKLDVAVTIIERAPNFDHAGYMLGLWPLGARVLHGLSLYERFAKQCIPGRQYEVRDNHGELIKRWSMDTIAERFGPNLSCTRPQLVKLLHDSLDGFDLRFNTELTTINQRDKEVTVAFSDGSQGVFDLVVGADGMHSQVRRLIFAEPSYFHTHWGGWVWWAKLDTVPPETYVDHWGVGRFFGAYPTQEGVGVFAGAPMEDGFDQPGEGRRRRLFERFSGMGKIVDACLQAIPDDDTELFFWRLSDIRSNEWTHGRIVLLGDAAASVLPTAGIGASMAMESAAVLADELSRTDAHFIEHALSLYVKRRKKRVEDAQEDSRNLARAMFLKSATLAHIRDVTTKFFTLEQLAGSIAKAFDEPI